MKTEDIKALWNSKDVFGKLRDRYLFTLKRESDFNAIAKRISESDYIVNEMECEEDESEIPIRAVYIGSHMSMAPSGKYYMPWCSNQTYRDEYQDSAWFDALQTVLDQYGMFFMHGEGCATDIFFCKQD